MPSETGSSLSIQCPRAWIVLGHQAQDADEQDVPAGILEEVTQSQQ